MAEFLQLLKYRMSEVYFVIIFTFLTFYMHNGYYDTLEAKSAMLFWTSLFYVVTMAISSVLLAGFEKKHAFHFLRSLNMLDYSLLLFAGLGLLSAALSDTKNIAFWGSDGCRIGACLIFLLCLASIFLSGNLHWNRYLLLVILLSGFIVYLWGITDCFDLDLMGWHIDMASNHYDFLSTIGNRDWYTGYISFVLPFIAVLFLDEQNKKMNFLYAIYLFFGFINLYITKNNGNLLVFGSVIWLVYYALKERQRWEQFIHLFWIFIFSSIAVNIMCILVNPLHVTGISILGILTKYQWYFALAAIALILQITKDKIFSLHLEKIWLCFSGLVIIGLFFAVILSFNGSFGSDRGYIWTYAAKTFTQSPIREKLIGWGPDCFKQAVYSIAGSDIYATWPENNLIANAHNEFLQYLITMGLFGMLSYLAIFVAAFTYAIKKKSTLCIASGTALFAYFCTALGYNPQPLNYGIFFVFLALLHLRHQSWS
ncbi:MAG: O-antigen ligase family protein [Clostridium sp.]|nr:O-antigen ligase family protein [Clostridium sp.]